jgi:hypothetical protein
MTVAMLWWSFVVKGLLALWNNIVIELYLLYALSKQHTETKDSSLVHGLLCSLHVLLYNAAKYVFVLPLRSVGN